MPVTGGGGGAVSRTDCGHVLPVAGFSSLVKNKSVSAAKKKFLKKKSQIDLELVQHKRFPGTCAILEAAFIQNRETHSAYSHSRSCMSKVLVIIDLLFIAVCRNEAETIFANGDD